MCLFTFSDSERDSMTESNAFRNESELENGLRAINSSATLILIRKSHNLHHISHLLCVLNHISKCFNEILCTAKITKVHTCIHCELSMATVFKNQRQK